jgi:hypothetical protein
MPEIEIQLNEEQVAILENFAAIRQLAVDDILGSLVIPAVVEHVEPETLIGVMVHRCK